MNIPGGDLASDYPPVAISRVIEGIDPTLNCEVSYINLDYYRPCFDKIKSQIQAFMPHVIGFSAILTPSYSYLKKLSVFIGENFPDVIQILGGQMAVISNIILLKTEIAFCVIGESEPTFSNLIRRLIYLGFDCTNMDGYADIKGIVILRNNIPHFTGYEKENLENGMRQFNYNLISQFTSLENYIHPVDGQYFRVRLINSDIKTFLNSVYSNNINKNMATVFASKGCVNNCSFCHRFYKGYKIQIINEVVSYIEKIKKDLNVGMVMFSEENFGTHKKATASLIEYLKDSALNWAAGAVRVKTVNEEVIKAWHESGCVHINFGVESLSQKMLDIMEKRTTVEENLNAIRLCYKYNIFTVVGLVIGMPGETEETIEETISNLSTVVPDNINIPFEVYINFVQAIPGTPVYEYAKRLGLIGQSLDEEEKYIESLYEINANELRHYLNFTDYEKEELAYWKYYITMELIVAYIKKIGFLNVFKHKKTRPYRIGLIYIFFPKRVRKPLLKYLLIMKSYGLTRMFNVVYKKISKRKAKRFNDVNMPLRKVLQGLPETLREDEASTAVFKIGH